MNDRGLVEVPENAVRDEPIAFGLTGVQLGICGVAVLVGAAPQPAPVWEPIRLAPHRPRAGPVVIAAAAAIAGRTRYRWLIRCGSASSAASAVWPTAEVTCHRKRR